MIWQKLPLIAIGSIIITMSHQQAQAIEPPSFEMRALAGYGANAVSLGIWGTSVLSALGGTESNLGDSLSSHSLALGGMPCLSSMSCYLPS